MTIYPAIDLLDGKCVRLHQGDYNKSTQVAEDPIETAKGFLDDGAEWLHVVDLNGAKNGDCSNFIIIEKLASTGLKIQTGGGIRDIKRIEQCFLSGVDKVILGSAAIRDKHLLEVALKKYNERIIVGVDVKDQCVRMSGWVEDSGINYIEFAKKLVKCGVKTIVYTDISKDGTLAGINIKPIEDLIKIVTDIKLIVGGGIATIDDINALLKFNITGAICGKSLYAKTLSLKDAIQRCRGDF
ncbi:MAG: 1-(5-phosphoribosyl)-5-[(5-phosphoribosylamino)methylideneamino]imidazole-4-carboxamide isomerase [Christensenellaceae bacterium]|jgi:phosphoribosylformimino-5-aminoimidazole carboxamide ribotide isomerase|nr:1-(5-phosphoribosyl)-5-[(5-phosphoribosylamino)methylideneamino]imidazole-4-carboxamide isomerase [Christensenellaceae bacterium]